jgi:CRP-like cAMP-binding protein
MSDAPSLGDFPLFAAVDHATLQRLSQDAKVEHYEDGAVIFRQGDAVSAVVLVLRGFVKLIRTSSCGDETLICIRSDGASLAPAPTSGEEVWDVSAESIGPSVVVRLPAGRFIRLAGASPQLAAAALEDAKRRIVALTSEIEALKARSADHRLARFLLSFCLPDQEQCRFRLPYDKRLVAARLGVTQETLSRAFARLRELGVRTETRDVLIESVSRLCAHFDEQTASRLGSDRRSDEENAS